MQNIINSLLGIHTAILNQGKVAYARLFLPAIVLFGLIFFVGLGFNLTGLKEINLIFSLILVLVTLTCSLRAEAVINIFFAGIISGMLQKSSTMPEETKKIFTWYVGLIGQIMLWASMVFFILGTLDARGHIKALLGILSAIILLQLIQAVWKIGRSWSKNFVYFYALIMLLVFAFSFISESVSSNEYLNSVSGFLKSQVAKIFQSSATYYISKGTTIYDYANGTLIPIRLKYEKSVEVISLHETTKQNGAIYEKVGLPDPTTGQQGKFVGWVFSGDLKNEAQIKVETDAQARVEAEARAKAEKAEADAKARAEAKKAKLEAETRAKSEAADKLKKAQEDLRLQAEKREANIKPITQNAAPPIIDRIDRYEIHISPLYTTWDTIQTGEWAVYPANTNIREYWEKTNRATNGSVIVQKDTMLFFYPPARTAEVILTRKR